MMFSLFFWLKDRRLVVASCTLFFAGSSLGAQTDTYAQTRSAPVSFKINAQPIGAALKQFAAQSGVQLVYESGDVDDREAVAGLTGTFTAEEALSRILAHTNLQYRFINERTVAIRHAQPTAPPPAAPAAPPKPHAAADPAVEPTSIGEVVVTAQKRSERLLDTPQSVSVISVDSIQKLGATQFRDFANTVPGLAFQSAGAGFTQVSLRGVTTGYDVTPTVGIVVDDVPYGSSSAFSRAAQLALDVGLFDVDRVEVLHGPQGTLYGASTMGGLIKYVTKAPNANSLEAQIQTGVSDTHDGGINYSGAISGNVPIIANTLAMRGSAFYSRDAGYIDNLALADRNVNRSSVYGGRVGFLLTPLEGLSLRVDSFLQNITRDGSSTADYSLTGNPLYGALSQRRLIPEAFNQQFRLVSANITYKMPFATLTSITSYQNAEAEFIVDDSPALVPVLALCPPFCRSYSAAEIGNRTTTHKMTQEVRLTSQEGGAFDWLLGGFYTHESGTNHQELLLLDVLAQPALNDLFHYFTPSIYKEYAAFADLTYHFTDQFDVSGGIRYAKNEQTYTQIASGLLIGPSPTLESSASVPTYLVNARYHLSQDATAYVRYATGYRPGGPNAVSLDPFTGNPQNPTTFGADKLKSYEAGLKAQSTDRAYGIDAAVYYIDWKDLQELTTSPSGVSYYANAKSAAHIRGAELNLTAHPIPDLFASGSFAFQDAKMVRADPNLGAESGERLPNVPRLTGSLNADYTLPLAADWKPTVGASIRGVTERNSSFSHNTSVTLYRLPGYTTVDFRAGVTFQKTSVQLYLRNVLDRLGQTIQPAGVSAGGGPFEVAILQPRTVGVTVNTSF